MSSFVSGDESQTGQRFGFFTDIGFGGGMFLAARDASGVSILNPSVALETRIGGNINGNLSVFLLTHLNIISFNSVAAFTGWIFEGDESLIMRKSPLIMVIPFAALFDSELFVGPGLMYHAYARAPSFYIEGGAGYFSFQTLAYQSFVIGSGLFIGIGVDITNDIKVGLRLLYAPNFWTTSKDSFLSSGIFIYL
jgi:hypothetical protein